MNDPTDSTEGGERDQAALAEQGWSSDTYDKLVLAGVEPGRFADLAALARDEREIFVLCAWDDANLSADGRGLIGNYGDGIAYLANAIVSVARGLAHPSGAVYKGVDVSRKVK